ncbi:hypothetical protein, partial [Neisseria meningitidis]|uniref:hypothetical protein n=1 Tax=Neisseria meningitidis TaxID=487 RepID=UPI001C994F5F
AALWAKSYADFVIVIPPTPTRERAAAEAEMEKRQIPMSPAQYTTQTGPISRLRGNNGNTGRGLLSGFACSSW